jgi:SulP family sulfate permease
LEAINRRLKDGGVSFHLSEVKGSVMDRLKRSQFLMELTGKVHLSQYDAVASIKPESWPAVRVTRSENHRGSRRKACGDLLSVLG